MMNLGLDNESTRQEMWDLLGMDLSKFSDEDYEALLDDIEGAQSAYGNLGQITYEYDGKEYTEDFDPMAGIEGGIARWLTPRFMQDRYSGEEIDSQVHHRNKANYKMLEEFLGTDEVKNLLSSVKDRGLDDEVKSKLQEVLYSKANEINKEKWLNKDKTQEQLDDLEKSGRFVNVDGVPFSREEIASMMWNKELQKDPDLGTDFYLPLFGGYDAVETFNEGIINIDDYKHGGTIPSEYLYGGALPKAGWGLDLGGWLRGEQGWIPDVGGKSTTESWQDGSKKVQKYADMAAMTGIPGVSHLGGYTSAAIDYGDAALAYSQGDYETAAKEFGKGTLTAGLTTVPGGNLIKTGIKGGSKALNLGKNAKNLLTTTSKGINPLTTKVGDVTKGIVKDVVKKPVKAGIDSIGSNEQTTAPSGPTTIAGPNQNIAQNTTAPTTTTPPTTITPPTTTTTSAPTTPTTTTASTPPPAEPAIAETAPQSAGGREEYIPQSQRGKYGGDPFANNALREFIYGKAQDGKEIPEGWSEEAFKKATENGFVYDSESGTWSHPTYTEGNTNYYLNQIKDDYDISGVSEGIGEEGIPDIQQSGETEGGTKVYQGITDDQVTRWQEANKYIIDGIKDENGDPLFTEDNPFTPTQENIKLVQQGKNDYLDRLLETDPSIKEKYTDDDGNFNQEAYYKDYHGYYGDGAQAIDGKLGEYTVSDLGMQKKPSDPPEVTINEPDPEEPEPIDPGEVTTTTETERPEFWLQDQIKYTDLVRQKLGLRKYRPWAATFSPETLDATIVDPGRAIAAIQEGAKTAGDSTVFAGPAANRAMKLKAQGQAAKSVADIWAQNQEANLRSVAETNKINTLIKNEAAEKNLNIKNTLFKDNIAVDKEYDNALRDINSKLANQLANSYTNMANTYNMNSLYPQFNIDPGSGGFVDFTNPQELFANKNVDDRTKTEKLADTIAELKANNIDPKTLPKEVWNDLLADNTGGGNSELDEVKDAITQGGYQNSGQTGMLGGYPGTEEARYGGEKAKRLAKKGRELRQWFSPLQGGMAD